MKCEMESKRSMKIGMVWHHNLIEEEINYSYKNHPDVDGKEYIGRQIFCKKLHKISEPLKVDCDGCPYFAGFMQGHGHECAWEDDMDDIDTYGTERVIRWSDRKKELCRVSGLIDKGIIRKG